MIKLLKDLVPYVIVTGSYAEGKQTAYSDIDFYIKMRPEDEYNPEDPKSEETYVSEIITIIEKHGYKWGSVFVSSIHVDNTPIKLEFSAYYQVDLDHIFTLNILGVNFQAAKSTYEKGSN